MDISLAGAIIIAALPLACVAFGLLHLIQAKVNAMSLLQDAEAVLGKIESAVEAAVAPLHAKIAEAEAALAAKVSELETALSEKGDLLARLEQFGEHLVGIVTPAPVPSETPVEPAA